jgi:CHAT domain-containing protein/uncharacterized protein HemY
MQPRTRKRNLNQRKALFLLPCALILLLLTPPPTLCNQSPVLAQATQSGKTEAERLLQTGRQLAAKGQYQAALKTLQQALTLYQQGNDRTQEAITLLGIAAIHQQMGEFANALAALQQALELHSVSKLPPATQSSIWLEFGIIYQQQEQFAAALDAFQKALSFAREAGARSQQNSARTGVQLAARSIGVVYERQRQYDRALALYQQALAVIREGDDRKSEASVLLQIGRIYEAQQNRPKAIETYEQALAIARQTQQTSLESTILFVLGATYGKLTQYDRALERYQQALAIRQQLKEPVDQALVLNNIGSIYNRKGEYRIALEHHQRALALLQQEKVRPIEPITPENIDRICANPERVGEGRILELLQTYCPQKPRTDAGMAASLNQVITSSIKLYQVSKAATLNNIGSVYSDLGRNAEAIAYHEQALEIFRQLQLQDKIVAVLNNLGKVYLNTGQYPKALTFFEQSLAISRAIRDLDAEVPILNNIAQIYNNQGQFRQALEMSRRVLALAEKVDAHHSRLIVLNNLGTIHIALSEYPEALKLLQQALSSAQEIGDRSAIATTLNNIATVYSDQGEYTKALALNQQALAIFKEIGESGKEATSLANIADIYRIQGNYAQELELYQQALAIWQRIGDRQGEAFGFFILGSSQRILGQYEQALKTYDRGLAISREVGDRAIEANLLAHLGTTYFNLKQYDKSLELQQQSLRIHREIGALLSQASNLTGMGRVYNAQGKSAQALEFLNQALVLARELGVPSQESTVLNLMGDVQTRLGQYTDARISLQQGLTIATRIGDRRVQASALSDLGALLVRQNQPELAIVFYKQSVNVTESIRQGLGDLFQEQQESYTATIAETYRSLASLLLQRDRILEAQQVLELLRVQELDDYLRNVRGTQQQLAVLLPETEILQRYNRLQQTAIQSGQELTQLRQKPNRTNAEEQRIAQLVKLETEINQQFNQFIDSPEIVNLVQQLSRSARRQNLNLEDLNALRDNLRQHRAVLLYPLILDDRLELILTTPDSPPIRRTVSVKREELNRLITEFRLAVKERRDDNPLPVAQQLYNYLIRPLEADLKQAKVETIVYAPDQQLRYIPLAALYDGQQWLVQRYQVNHITARSLTDFSLPQRAQQRVLAGAFVQGRHQLQVGQRRFEFQGLPFAGKEIELLAAMMPHTTQLIDAAFGRDRVLPRMNDYNILHFATHAAFVPGQPEDSFIVFGDGSYATLRDIENWSLSDVDLVVLSACETGVGGLGNGEEILGLGYQFQRAGARAAIASLWTVDDGGTQMLMNAFYAALKQPGTTKAAALRQAQLALITGNHSAIDQGTPARGLGVVAGGGSSGTRQSDRAFTHPYYWAPFILIGNGL